MSKELGLAHAYGDHLVTRIIHNEIYIHSSPISILLLIRKPVHSHIYEYSDEGVHCLDTAQWDGSLMSSSIAETRYSHEYFRFSTFTFFENSTSFSSS